MELRIKSSRWNAFVDLQYRAVQYKTSGTDDDLTPYDFSDDLNFFNPKAGVSYSLGANDVLYASYAVRTVSLTVPIMWMVK